MRYASQRLGETHWFYNRWATKWLGGLVQEWIIAFELEDAFRVELIGADWVLEDVCSPRLRTLRRTDWRLARHRPSQLAMR